MHRIKTCVHRMHTSHRTMHPIKRCVRHTMQRSASKLGIIWKKERGGWPVTGPRGIVGTCGLVAPVWFMMYSKPSSSNHVHLHVVWVFDNLLIMLYSVSWLPNGVSPSQPFFLRAIFKTSWTAPYAASAGVPLYKAGGGTGRVSDVATKCRVALRAFPGKWRAHFESFVALASHEIKQHFLCQRPEKTL